jgi:hypothetical protein
MVLGIPLSGQGGVLLPRWESSLRKACGNPRNRRDSALFRIELCRFTYLCVKELHTAGFYETEHYRQIIKDIRATVGSGRLIAVAGIVGSGKTMETRTKQGLN